MADVKLRFQISDDGTVKVLDDVASKTKGIGDEAERTSQRASKAFDVMKGAAVATVAAVGAATAATVAAVNRQFTQIDELAKVSRATGVAVRDLSGLQVAADLAGVSLEGVGTALGIFSRRLVEAQSGTGKSGRIFDALGIDPRSGASTQQFLEQIADRFQELGTGAEATALSMELFGRSGARMVNLLVQGGDAIREAREQASIFGLVVEDEAAAAVEQYNDNLSRLGSIATGAAREIASELAPALAGTTDQIVRWVIANDELIDQRIDQWAEGAAAAFSLLERAVTASVPPIVAAVDQISAALATYDSLPGWLKSAIENEGRGAVTGGFPGFFRALGGRLAGGSGADLGRELTGGEVMLGTVGGSSNAETSLERQRELIERIRGAMGEVRRETQGAARSTAEQADETQRAAEAAQLVPGVVRDWVQPIEEAQRAAVTFGDIFTDSIVSAVDNLIASGDFNLEDVFESTGRAAMSRMVKAILDEKLGLDAAFEANFLGFLPRIASQGGDLVAQGFGAGLSSIVQQASNVGSVVSGSLRVGGLGAFADTGYGMSLSPDFGLMTSAATGLPEIVSGGAPLAAGAAGASGGLLSGLSGLLGPLALFGGAAALSTGFFGLFNDRPSQAEIGRSNIRDAFRSAGLIRGMALQEPNFAFDPANAVRQPGGFRSIYRDRLVDMNRQGTPLFNVNSTADPRRDAVFALAALLQEDATEINGSQFNSFLSDIPLRGGQLFGGLSGESLFGSELRRLASGLDPVESVIALNAGRMQFEDGRLDAGTYNAGLRGLFDLLTENGTIVRGVDALAIANENLVNTTRGLVVQFEDFGEELDRQTRIAESLNSGVASAAGTAAGEILRGDVNARANFGNSILDAVLGGVGSNVTSRLLQDGGVLANLQQTIVGAIFGGDASSGEFFGSNLDMVRDALSGTGEAFDEINSLLAQFIPLFDEFRREIEDTTGVSSQAYRDQRTGVIDLIGDIRFGRLSPSQQESVLRANLSRDQSTLDALLVGGIDDSERARFDSVTGRIVGDAQRLNSLRGNFATGTPQQRFLDQAVDAALMQVESALEMAVGNIETQQIQVATMNVSELRITPQAVQSIVGG